MMEALKSRTSTLREVQATLEAIASSAQSLNSNDAALVCIVNCMQLHRAEYYQKLMTEFGVRAVLYGGGGSFKTAIARTMLGSPALLFLDRFEVLPELTQRVGEQALAGVYMLQARTLDVELKLLSSSQIREAVLSDPMHLMYDIDEDAAGEDGRVLEVLSIGSACPQLLRTAVNNGEAVQSSLSAV